MQTVRLSFDIPIDRLTAVSEAVVAILNPPAEPVEALESERKPFDKLKGGNLAKQAGIMCSNPAFLHFLIEQCKVTVVNADGAALWLRKTCSVASRAELDHNPEAAKKFEQIRRSFTVWMLAPSVV